MYNWLQRHQGAVIITRQGSLHDECLLSSLQDEEQERVFDTGPGAVTAEGAELLLPKHRDKEMNLLPHSALST